MLIIFFVNKFYLSLTYQLFRLWNLYKQRRKIFQITVNINYVFYKITYVITDPAQGIQDRSHEVNQSQKVARGPALRALKVKLVRVQYMLINANDNYVYMNNEDLRVPKKLEIPNYFNLSTL